MLGGGALYLTTYKKLCTKKVMLFCSHFFPKPASVRLSVIGQLRALTHLDGALITEQESATAIEFMATSRITQVWHPKNFSFGLNFSHINHN